MIHNNLMNKLGRLALHGRPQLPEDLNVTLICESSSFARLWIKSVGCSHSNDNGSCIPCDYWSGSKISPELLLSEIRIRLETLTDFPPKLLLLNTNGSVLDSLELSKSLRQNIFSLITEILPNTKIIIETRVETINEESLQDLSIFNNNNVALEVGIESSSQIINTLCCNKGLNLLPINSVVKMCQNLGYEVIANVLVGLPFLTYREIIKDAVETIHWCLSIGFSSCVIFPVNIKPWTILHWLYKNSYYNPISLWALVEVLLQIEPSFLNKIEISWYPSLKQNLHPLYTIPTIIPQTCSKCNSRVNTILQQYAKDSNKRQEIVNLLANFECDCRISISHSSINETFNYQKIKQIQTQYEKIAVHTLELKWSNKNQNDLNRLFNDLENF